MLDNIEYKNIYNIFNNNKIKKEELRIGFDNLYRKEVSNNKYNTIDNINQFLNNKLKKYNKKIDNNRVQENKNSFKLYYLIDI